jgi:hypothetical protein
MMKASMGWLLVQVKRRGDSRLWDADGAMWFVLLGNAPAESCWATPRAESSICLSFVALGLTRRVRVLHAQRCDDSLRWLDVAEVGSRQEGLDGGLVDIDMAQPVVHPQVSDDKNRRLHPGRGDACLPHLRAHPGAGWWP